jgi:hypothetical protein
LVGAHIARKSSKAFEIVGKVDFIKSTIRLKSSDLKAFYLSPECALICSSIWDFGDME